MSGAAVVTGTAVVSGATVVTGASVVSGAAVVSIESVVSAAVVTSVLLPHAESVSAHTSDNAITHRVFFIVVPPKRIV